MSSFVMDEFSTPKGNTFTLYQAREGSFEIYMNGTLIYCGSQKHLAEEWFNEWKEKYANNSSIVG